MNQAPEGYFAIIGNYYVGKTIGRGTFGKVKMGLHTYTMENVAIKILDKDKIVDESDKIRVAREIQILRKIRHPNIIQLYEIIESQTQLFLITEYAPNNELFDFIVKRNRLNERQSARFLLQILSAVEYLHQNNIVHRDLKPENLLLDCNNNIKVVDFGLSNMYEDGQTLKTACGSPCYAAPEMVSGKRYEGLKTDIWSCGIILYAMLCGYLPFEDSNTTDLYKKIINDPVKLPKFLTDRSKSILNGILEKNPEKRFTIEAIRKHDFCILNSNQPILKGIIFGKDDILVDPLILQIIKDQYGIDSEQARVMIQNNKHNQVTATYYLLLNSHIRNGGVSIADLSRPPPKKTLSLNSDNQKEASESPSKKTQEQNAILKENNDKNGLQQDRQQVNVNYSERVSAMNKQAPNKSSTPIKKSVDNKPPLQNFEQYVALQQRINKEKQKDSTPDNKGKNGSYINSPLIQSPEQDKQNSKNAEARILKEDKQPFVVIKSPLKSKQISYDETESSNKSPNFSPNTNKSKYQDQQSSQKEKQSGDINFIKGYNLTESTVRKQNFFQEEEQINNISATKEKQNNQNIQNIDIENQPNNKQAYNSTFGSGFKLSEKGSPIRKVKLNNIQHQQQQSLQKGDSSNSNNLNEDNHHNKKFDKQISQESENLLSEKSLSKNNEKSDDEEQPTEKSPIKETRVLLENDNKTRNINQVSAEIKSASLDKKQNIQTNNQNQQKLNGVNNLYNIQISKLHYSKAGQKARNGQESTSEISANKSDNQITLQNHSEIYQRTDANVNVQNYKISSATRRGNNSSKEEKVTTQLQLQIIQQSDNPQQINQISNKNQSKIIVKIHQKTKSETGFSRKLMSMNGINQKENVNNDPEEISNMKSPQIKPSVTAAASTQQQVNSQIKNTNEKIANLIRSANQKGGINAFQKDVSAQSQYKQYLPAFFNNQQYSSSLNAPNVSNSIINNTINSSNINNNTIETEKQQQNQSQNNYNSKHSSKTPCITEPTYHETSSIRQKLKIISQRNSTLGNSAQAFKVRIRKSATPELNNINSSLNNHSNQSNIQNTLFVNGSHNLVSQQQKRSNSNNNITNNQNPAASNSNNLQTSPEKKFKTKQISRSSRRFVSAERENNQMIQQSLLDDPTKNKFFRQGSSSIQKNIQNYLNIIEKNSASNINNTHNTDKTNLNIVIKKPENSDSIGQNTQSESKKQDLSNNLTPSINKEAKEPKIRVISESPMCKKDQHSNESKYYLGLKQQMIQKEPLICNFSINNDSNINHHLTNNDGINSTIDDIVQQKSNQKLTSWPHSQNYYLNAPVTNSSNKSYLNNISNSSRISSQLNEQQQQSLQAQTLENSRSEHMKYKAVTNSLITNSYSLVNVQKYKVRKSKINSGLHNISNSIMNVNSAVASNHTKDK
ncbi:hypothetical protein ABPG74_000869 [Tetrahymena malaccensis]